MRAAVVVKSDPVADGARRVLDALEAMAVNALFFECADHVLEHTMLLWAMRGDKVLFQAIAADQCREVAAGKNEPIV